MKNTEIQKKRNPLVAKKGDKCVWRKCKGRGGEPAVRSRRRLNNNTGGEVSATITNIQDLAGTRRFERLKGKKIQFGCWLA